MSKGLSKIQLFILDLFDSGKINTASPSEISELVYGDCSESHVRSIRRSCKSLCERGKLILFSKDRQFGASTYCIPNSDTHKKLIRGPFGNGWPNVF